jgi:hypothetical protein
MEKILRVRGCNGYYDFSRSFFSLSLLHDHFFLIVFGQYEQHGGCGYVDWCDEATRVLFCVICWAIYG